jgi:hypothetical protein
MIFVRDLLVTALEARHIKETEATEATESQEEQRNGAGSSRK